jgi:hypothetical protein
MRFFIEWNRGFISCIHRASAQIQNSPYLCTGCKYKDKDVLNISGKILKFFWERSKKCLELGQKFRVGQVSGNTTFFFF